MKPPYHVAIILDGNRRWAKEHGLPTFEGHRRGFKKVVAICKEARKLGIHTITLWGFSTENWQRSEKEVDYLMKFFETMIDAYLKEAQREKIRIIHLGRKERLPKSLLQKIKKAEEKTKENKRYILNIALDYGGRDEIIRAIKKMSPVTCHLSHVTEKKFSQFLDTANQPYPNPDLIIRTSGEQRISGLFIWQAAYAEFYFEPCHLPDFTPAKFRKAIQEYSQRKRRFGK